MTIKDGHLWELALFKGLAKLLFIQEFQNVVFREAGGDFTIANRRIHTNGFELRSAPVSFICNGWMDFNGNLDLDMGAQFSPQTIEESGSLNKTITALLTQTGEYLTIKVTGNIKEPRLIPSPVGMIKKATDILRESLKNIFQ